jgi:hypothetical protein
MIGDLDSAFIADIASDRTICVSARVREHLRDALPALGEWLLVEPVAAVGGFGDSSADD